MKDKTKTSGRNLCTIGLALAFISGPVMATGGKGMTWGYRGPVDVSGNSKLVHVGCHAFKDNGYPNADLAQSCNAYQGATSCAEKRHILCIKNAGNLKRPPYDVRPGGELYAGWSPKKIKLGPKKRGSDLTSLSAANGFCGAGWRMASHNDGYYINGMNAQKYHKNSSPPWSLNQASRGGWSFHARFQGNNNRLNKLKKQRFWVHIKTKANCWNP